MRPGGSVIQGSFVHHAPGAARQAPPHITALDGRFARPLPADVRQLMEGAFRSSFADVRIHVGPEAASIGAHAFTHGSMIYFAPGQYDPATPRGRQILGHELAHVLQQRAGRVKNPFGSGVAIVHDRMLETEADRLALKVAAAAPAPAHQPPRAQAAMEPVQLKRKRKFKGTRMSLGEFHARMNEAQTQEWRRWNSHSESLERHAGLPPSTDLVPSVLTHVTHYSALPSIRATGLDPAFRNSSNGLNSQSGTSKYTKRDGSLEVVYLGRTADVGKSMEDEEESQNGGRVTLVVRLPWAFRMRYTRFASAVISDNDGHFDNRSTGSTVLSFARIPPQYISVRDPRTGREVPLVNMRPGKGGEFDFRPYATAPRDNNEPLLSNQDLIDRQRRISRTMERTREVTIELPPPPSRRSPSPPRTMSITISQSMLDRVREREQEHQQQLDDDDW